MLRTLGLQRSQLSSGEINLLNQVPIEQRDLVAQEMAAEQSNYNYGILPEQSQEGMLHIVFADWEYLTECNRCAPRYATAAS